MTLKGFGNFFLMVILTLLVLLMSPFFAVTMGRLPVYNPWPRWRRKSYKRR